MAAMTTTTVIATTVVAEACGDTAEHGGRFPGQDEPDEHGGLEEHQQADQQIHPDGGHLEDPFDETAHGRTQRVIIGRGPGREGLELGGFRQWVAAG